MATVLEPASTPDLRALLLDYLDFYRSVVVAKVSGAPAEFLASSAVPSGWTPAGLVNHLVHMERRWILWGFLAEPVPHPWADSAGTGWVQPDADEESLIDALLAQGNRTREVVQAYQLTDHARVGGRFESVEEAPQLHWILLHVLQEYARHAGHLDIVRELADGATGEEP